MVETLATGVLLIVLGVVLAGLGVHQLGVVRAARKWPLARQPRVGRGLAGLQLAVGILASTGGGVVLATLLRLSVGVRLGVAAGTGLAILLLGMLLAAKLVDRVELNALIRSPSPLYRTTAPGPGGQYQTATDPSRSTSPPPAAPGGADAADRAVPSGAQPGWIFTDHAGSWYLCVTTGNGHRLVQLPDFRLVTAEAGQRLTVAGTVELTVWPLAGADDAVTSDDPSSDHYPVGVADGGRHGAPPGSV
ncbi:MAG: hypothetical protein WCA46_15035 [Actinocatenispora sp.]